MITFNKEDLEFLNMYTMVADAKKTDISVYGNILFKANSETGKVMFAQSSVEAEMITEFDKKVTESFQIIMPAVIVNDLIKQLPSESEITFKKEGIYFNGNRYAFEQHDIVFIDYEKYVELAKSSEIGFTMIDLDKFVLSKNFIGHENYQLDSVMLTQGYFISSNGGDAITAAIKTFNDKDKEYYSSKTLLDLIITNKKKQAEIAFYKDDETEECFSIVKINNTLVILKEKEYFIPPVFETDYKEIYDHNNFVKVKKKEFLSVFNRIKLFTNDAYNYRFHVKCNTTDSVELETKDENYACEQLNAAVTKNLVGKSISLSAQYLGSVLKDLSGEFIYFYVSENCDYAEESEIEGCRIQDEKTENFYITILLEGN